MKTTKWKTRLAAGLLSALMVTSMLPATAFAAGTTRTAGTWAELIAALNSASAGDTIQLTNDIDAVTTASLKVSKSVTVDGQGYTIDGQGKYGMFVTKGGTLTLKNTVLANAYRGSSKKACAIYAYSGGGANLENCILYNCVDNYSGYGAIYCSSYPLNMTNCTVIDNANGVTIGNTGGTIKNSIITGSTGTDVIFKSSSSQAVDGGYNLIGTTQNKPSGFSNDTSTIDSSLTNHSAWLTGEGDLIAGDSNPAINKIPSDPPCFGYLWNSAPAR